MREAARLEALARLARKVRRLQDQTSKAREELYAAIQAAHRDGYSIRTLATITGLSTGRVHQITKAGDA